MQKLRFFLTQRFRDCHGLEKWDWYTTISYESIDMRIYNGPINPRINQSASALCGLRNNKINKWIKTNSGTHQKNKINTILIQLMELSIESPQSRFICNFEIKLILVVFVCVQIGHSIEPYVV